MISHELRCIFIHIPKTGGTSISKKLGMFDVCELGVQDHRTIRDVRRVDAPFVFDNFHRKQAAVSRRSLLCEYVADKLGGTQRVAPQQFHSYFKFTFVRNPWARIYSWYNNMMCPPHKENFGIPDGLTFAQFVESGCWPSLRIRQAWWSGRGPGRRRVYGHGFYSPAWSEFHWIADRRGRIPFDEIGRYENFPHDWDRICGRLGIEDSKLDWCMKGHAGQCYVDAYDDSTRRRVGEMFRATIDHFGYRFGDAVP